MSVTNNVITVKNISGNTMGFDLGSRGATLANNATATAEVRNTDDLAKITALVDAGYLQIVNGPPTTQILSAVTKPAYGYISLTGNAVDAETITIGTTVFEIAADANSVTDPSYIWAEAVATDTPADTAAGLISAINKNSATTGVAAEPSAVVVGSETLVLLKATNGVTDGSTIALAETFTNGTVSGATLTDGAQEGFKSVSIINHTVTAGDVSEGFIQFNTGLSAINHFQVTLRDDVGTTNTILLPADATFQVSGGTLVVSRGTTVWAAGDIIHVLAFS